MAFIACYYSPLKRLFLKGSYLSPTYFLYWTLASVTWPATGGGIFRNLVGHPAIQRDRQDQQGPGQGISFGMSQIKRFILQKQLGHLVAATGSSHPSNWVTSPE